MASEDSHGVFKKHMEVADGCCNLQGTVLGPCRKVVHHCTQLLRSVDSCLQRYVSYLVRALQKPAF